MKHKIEQIAIIGLGLIGGSLAKALKEKGYKIVGITKDPKTIKLALKEKAINKGFTILSSKTLEDTDLIFICTPLHLIKEYLNKISKLKLKNSVIITDVGSTKLEICDYAAKLFLTNAPLTGRDLSRHYSFFIGGHPMAGTEKIGFTSSTKNLFKDCAWILTPQGKNKNSLTTLKTIIKKIGAKPIITTPEKHDQAIALISHLPLLASIGLCNIAKESSSRELASIIASSGFRDTTRIASGNPEMNSNLLISNSQVLKKILPAYFKELNNTLKMAETKLKSLYKKLNTVSSWRNKLYNLKGGNNLLNAR